MNVLAASSSVFSKQNTQENSLVKAFATEKNNVRYEKIYKLFRD